MTHQERLRRSREAQIKRLNARNYVVTWRSTADHLIYSGIQGFKDLAHQLDISEHSLRCYFARGAGVHSLERTNPTTGEPDLMTITRTDPPAKPKRPRGRPRKTLDATQLGDPSNF